ncbi:MAG: hypothetical protein JNL19_03900 [Burkholderiales bacterium]|nr:hypothetical protein [Burkholderiales bacterium]
MSLLRRDAPPPVEAWDALREWSQQSGWHRYLASLRVMLPFTSVIIGLAAVALLYAEPSLRSVKLVLGLWAFGVPVTALGYMRRMNRAAAQVPPITPASLDPTTAVDIRSGNRSAPPPS